MKLFKIWQILNEPYLITNKDIFNSLEEYSNNNNLSEMIEKIKYKTLWIKDAVTKDYIGKIYNSKLDDIAFIQFSSGSTGDPRGVTLTHENLLVNIKQSIKRAKFTLNDTFLSWMPLTHDMGLIGFHLVPFYLGIDQYIMSTELFVRRPTLWLEKASKHKVSILGSPNFGYRHCLKFLNRKLSNNFDLASIRLIFNGAEPISKDLCDEFLDKASQFGLKNNTIYPVYGLAEASVAVSFPPPEEEIKFVTLNRNYLGIGQEIIYENSKGKGVTFLDVGYPLDGIQLRVVDKKGNNLFENTIGHIQIKGKNVTEFYYNNPADTKKVIKEDGWLDTGDLGFMKEGRLIITGRVKDIIFLNGQNYYSHDIERIAQEISEFNLKEIAVCSIFDNKSKEEKLLCFVRYRKRLENFIPLVIKLKKHLRKRNGLEVKYVIPVSNIPKTTSGKIQRYKLSEMYQKGHYSSLIKKVEGLINRKMVGPINETEKELINICSKLAGEHIINVDDNLYDLGFTSIKLAAFVSEISELFNLDIV